MLLGTNVVSTVCCWALGGIALLDNSKGRELVPVADGKGEEEEVEGEGCKNAPALPVCGGDGGDGGLGGKDTAVVVV